MGQSVNTKRSTVSISSQRELDELFWREDVKICDIISMSPYVAEVIVESEAGFNRPNMKANCIVAAHTTGFARVKMDQAFRQCIKHQYTLHYSDTGIE